MQRCVKLTLVKEWVGNSYPLFSQISLKKVISYTTFSKFYKINKSILNYRINTTTWGWNHGSQSSKLVCFKFGLYFCWRSFLWHLHHKFTCNCQIYLVIWVVKFLLGDRRVDRFLSENVYFLNWCPNPIFDGLVQCQSKKCKIFHLIIQLREL